MTNLRLLSFAAFACALGCSAQGASPTVDAGALVDAAIASSALARSPHGYPWCGPDDEDPDGDGWGWIEAERSSCIVPGGPEDPTPRSPRGYPYCGPEDDDPDEPEGIDGDLAALRAEYGTKGNEVAIAELARRRSKAVTDERKRARRTSALAHRQRSSALSEYWSSRLTLMP